MVGMKVNREPKENIYKIIDDIYFKVQGTFKQKTLLEPLILLHSVTTILETTSYSIIIIIFFLLKN